MTVRVKYKITWSTGYTTYNDLTAALRFTEMMLQNGTPCKIDIEPENQ